jgi:nicotinate-nucleotide pyrophosphorylase (carboxylating)
MSVATAINYLAHLEESVRTALAEDIGTGDITARLVPENQQAMATVITREPAIVCGRPWFDEVFRQVDPQVCITWKKNEGDLVAPMDSLLEISGNARSILTAERTALNFLQTLMGTATIAHHYASLLKGMGTNILDTRKTIPGLRLAQKYAVKIGGAENHRIGLYDAFLIKENHIIACGSIQAATHQAREIAPQALLEIEVETLEELQAAIEAGVDRVMLDNFSEEQIQKAIELKPAGIQYEISGNITAEGLAGGITNGIDFVSSGALTKNVQAIDLSMRFVIQEF